MTAVSNLKPLSIGQLLDRAIRLYRQNFLLFIGIIALSQIPSTIFVVLVTFFSSSATLNDFSSFDPVASFAAMGVGFITLVVSVLMTQIGTAALTRAVADNYLGQELGIWDAYQKIGKSWLSLLGATILCGLLIFALFIFFIIPCIGWLAAIPGFGLIVFLSMVVVPLIAPVVVLEGKSAIQSISRAWSLARRRFWPVFGLVVLLTILVQLVVTGPTALVVGLLTTSSTWDPVLANVLQQLVSFLFSIIFLPIQLTCITLLYFDIRVRTEGFDLSLSVAKAEDEIIDMTAFTKESSGNDSNWRPTTSELGNFALITIGFVVFFGGLVGIMSLLGLAIGSAFGGL